VGTRKCAWCGIEVMYPKGDVIGWEGVQLYPNDVKSTAWYCPKPGCKAKKLEAMAYAAKQWGVGEQGTQNPAEVEVEVDDNDSDEDGDVIPPEVWG